MKLKQSFIFAFIPILLIVFGISGYIVYSAAENTITNYIVSTLKSRVEVTQLLLKNTAEDMAYFSVDAQYMKKRIGLYIIDQKIGDEGLVVIANEEGNVINGTVGEQEGKDINNESFFVTVRKEKNQRNAFKFQYMGNLYYGLGFWFPAWDWYVVFGINYKDSSATLTTIKRQIVLLASALAVVLIFIIILITSGIAKPIYIMKNAITKFEEKNIINQLPRIKSSVQEIQYIYQAVSHIITGFSNLIIEGRKDIAVFNQTVDNNQEAVGKIESSIYEMAQSVKEIMVLIEGIVFQNNDIAKKMTDVSNDSNSALDLLNKGDKILSGFKTRTQNLIKQTENISSSIVTISEISDQTNLLSLNAAIESSRVGSIGKGFEVVSSEIRKLADESDQITKAITGNIRKLKEELRYFLNEYQEMSQYFKDMHFGINDINSMNEQINAASKSQNESISNIANTINQMSSQFDYFRTLSRTLLKENQAMQNNIVELTNNINFYTTE